MTSYITADSVNYVLFLQETNTPYDVTAHRLALPCSPMERGVRWLHAIFDYPLMYEFKIKYNTDLFGLFSDTPDFSNAAYETALWNLSNDSLFWSICIDKKERVEVYDNPKLNEWTRYFLYSRDGTFFSYLHPEFYYTHENFINSYIVPFVSALNYIIKIEDVVEIYSFFITLVIQLFLCTFWVYFLISFLFSYYTDSTTDDNIVDQDFLISSMTVESEEELASIDDMVNVLFLLVFLFSWFFYVNGIFIFTNVPETSIIIYNFPFFYYLIVCIPTLLLYDFGILFLCYLRGASNSGSLAMELLYDYIAFAAYYIRLSVQNVRILLMVFTYFALYECVMTFMVHPSGFNNYENIWRAYNTATQYKTYYLLLTIPTQIIYWLYELFHTFFVITAQFIAFFAMVFWLFLFLFTMFVFEQQEKFFKERLEFRKKKIKELWLDYKNFKKK